MNKKNILILVLIVFIIGGAYTAYSSLIRNVDTSDIPQNNSTEGTSNEQTIENQKNTVPDFTVSDINGDIVSLKDFENQPIVINFWASWCPPCREEMSHFQEAYDTYSEKGVKFFMINSTDGERETVETATEYFNKNNYTMDIYFDTKENDFNASISYGVRSLPTTFFINKDGSLSEYKLGSLDKDTLFSSIENIIGE